MSNKKQWGIDHPAYLMSEQDTIGLFACCEPDCCKVMTNIYKGLKKKDVDQMFVLADKKHWRKVDKAIVYAYQPGGHFDFIFARDLERMIKPDSSWVRVRIPGTRLSVAYDEDNSVEVYGTILVCGQLMIYATDENGNYRDFYQEELQPLFAFLIDNYAKIIFHGDLIEAVAV